MYAEVMPLDTVFFRDGSPFTMGRETWGQSRFPPPPSVVYGALRTRYFAENPDRLEEAGQDGPTSDARLMSLHLRDDGISHFPLPRDLVEPEEEVDEDTGISVKRLCTTSMPTGSVGLGSPPHVLSHPKEVGSIRNAFLDLFDLEEYLHGRNSSLRAYRLYDDDLVHREPKIGIRMDRDTRAADDGFLYRVGLHRLGKDVSFGVRFDNLSVNETGMLKLGGEGKGARYEILADEPPVPDPPRNQIAADEAFVLYLATPAIFEHGWLPGWVDPASLRGRKLGVTVRLQAAAVGKPGAIGGWNVKEGHPKPLHRSVPAGSIYHFTLEDGTTESVVEAFHDVRISDERDYAGFGHAFVGAVPDKK